MFPIIGAGGVSESIEAANIDNQKNIRPVQKFVRSLSITIPAKYEDEIYKLYPTDIYYIETIDRSTYLYTAGRGYESSENLLSLEKILEAAGFIRVRKNCFNDVYSDCWMFL